MSWRTDLRPATWRGIPLSMMELGQEGGKRIVVDEPPESDDHAVAELGRKAPRFNIQGVLVGLDCNTRREQFIEACEEAGTGVLVHPWRGRLEVHCETWSCSNASDASGVVTFEATFVLAGGAARPEIEVDAPAETKVAAASCYASTASLLERIGAALDKLPGYYQSAVFAALAAEEAILAPLAGLSDAKELFAHASTVYGWMLAVARHIRSSFGSVGTPNEDAAEAAFDGYVLGYQVFAVARACEIAVDDTYPHADAASDRIAALVDALDVLLLQIDDIDLFDAMIDLRAQTVAALGDIANRLPRLRNYEVRSPTPAIVIAYDLYEDIGREQEIVELNNIQHPGFVMGTIKVLSR